MFSGNDLIRRIIEAKNPNDLKAHLISAPFKFNDNQITQLFTKFGPDDVKAFESMKAFIGGINFAQARLSGFPDDLFILRINEMITDYYILEKLKRWKAGPKTIKKAEVALNVSSELFNKTASECIDGWVSLSPEDYLSALDAAREMAWSMVGLDVETMTDAPKKFAGALFSGWQALEQKGAGKRASWLSVALSEVLIWRLGTPPNVSSGSDIFWSYMATTT